MMMIMNKKNFSNDAVLGQRIVTVLSLLIMHSFIDKTNNNKNDNHSEASSPDINDDGVPNEDELKIATLHGTKRKKWNKYIKSITGNK